MIKRLCSRPEPSRMHISVTQPNLRTATGRQSQYVTRRAPNIWRSYFARAAHSARALSVRRAHGNRRSTAARAAARTMPAIPI
eukprot:349976-Chlamydomonas_euryale.AAC.1